MPGFDQRRPGKQCVASFPSDAYTDGPWVPLRTFGFFSKDVGARRVNLSGDMAGNGASPHNFQVLQIESDLKPAKWFGSRLQSLSPFVQVRRNVIPAPSRLLDPWTFPCE